MKYRAHARSAPLRSAHEIGTAAIRTPSAGPNEAEPGHAGVAGGVPTTREPTDRVGRPRNAPQAQRQHPGAWPRRQLTCDSCPSSGWNTRFAALVTPRGALQLGPQGPPGPARRAGRQRRRCPAGPERGRVAGGGKGENAKSCSDDPLVLEKPQGGSVVSGVRSERTRRTAEPSAAARWRPDRFGRVQHHHAHTYARGFEHDGARR